MYIMNRKRLTEFLHPFFSRCVLSHLDYDELVYLAKLYVPTVEDLYRSCGALI